MHEIAHHFEWFLTGQDQEALLFAFEKARALHPSDWDAYHLSSPSEWWAAKVVEFEKERFLHGQDALLPFYRKLLVRTQQFLAGALAYHRKNGNVDAVRSIYDEILRTRGKIRTVDGLVDRMQTVDDMGKWKDKVRGIEEKIRSEPPPPRGVEGG